MRLQPGSRCNQGVFYSESSDQDVHKSSNQAHFKPNFEHHENLLTFTEDDQESSFLERLNQVIKAILWQSNFLIPVASASIGGMEVTIPCSGRDSVHNPTCLAVLCNARFYWLFISK